MFGNFDYSSEIRAMQKNIERLKNDHREQMDKILKENERYIKKYNSLLNTFKALLLSSPNKQVYISHADKEKARELSIIREHDMIRFGDNYKLVDTNSFLNKLDND